MKSANLDLQIKSVNFTEKSVKIAEKGVQKMNCVCVHIIPP